MTIPEVWVVWPTVHIEQSKKMVKLWKAKGYKTAVLVNTPQDPKEIGADLGIIQAEWKGFPTAVNVLCHSVPGDVVVVVGDDIFPSEEHTAQELRERFLERFPDMNGVIQPTGDHFGSIDTCAVSPWIGREFIESSYEGRGPFFSGYFHYFSDHELQMLAVKENCFAQWKDVSQFHDHWQREKGARRPEHLNKAGEKWMKDKKTFEMRQRRGFPGHDAKANPDHIREQERAWKAWHNKHCESPSKRESASGNGSTLENTKEIREALPGLLKRHGIKSMVDVPCGDWNWMSCVNLHGVKYLGLDVVPRLIRDNRRNYPGIPFQVFNVVVDVPIKSDLILCRDLLFHLPDLMAVDAIKNMKRSGTKWLLATSFPNHTKNESIPNSKKVGWRKVNLSLPPFNLPKPVEFIQENDSSACLGRTIGLFNLENFNG